MHRYSKILADQLLDMISCYKFLCKILMFAFSYSFGPGFPGPEFDFFYSRGWSILLPVLFISFRSSFILFSVSLPLGNC